MPIYAYKCTACGHAEDVLQKMSDNRLTECPACKKSTYEKQVTAAGFQLKGSGWYVTDFRNNSGGTSKTSEAAVGKNAAESGSESASSGSDAASGNSKGDGNSTAAASSTDSGSTSGSGSTASAASAPSTTASSSASGSASASSSPSTTKSTNP